MAPHLCFLIQGRHPLASAFEPRFSTQIYKAFQHIPLLESSFRNFFLWVLIVINTWLVFKERLFNQVQDFFPLPCTFLMLPSFLMFASFYLYLNYDFLPALVTFSSFCNSLSLHSSPSLWNLPSWQSGGSRKLFSSSLLLLLGTVSVFFVFIFSASRPTKKDNTASCLLWPLLLPTWDI